MNIAKTVCVAAMWISLVAAVVIMAINGGIQPGSGVVTIIIAAMMLFVSVSMVSQ